MICTEYREKEKHFLANQESSLHMNTPWGLIITKLSPAANEKTRLRVLPIAKTTILLLFYSVLYGVSVEQSKSKRKDASTFKTFKWTIVYLFRYVR